MRDDFFNTKRYHIICFIDYISYHFLRSSDDAQEAKDPNDDYMKLFRTFEMEGRAPATDRSKTTEEIVKEENEKLLKLEVS